MGRTKKSTTSATAKNGRGKKKGENSFAFLARRFNFKAPYFNTVWLVVILFGIFSIGVITGSFLANNNGQMGSTPSVEHWMLLERGENREYLYLGVPGDKEQSKLVKEFVVKTGMPGQRPTPLPLFFGKEYWKIVKKYPSYENTETAPYFLELDIPVEDGFFGPVPYPECNGQCSWEVPGYFGLHGVNGDASRLSTEDPGSSGCIRHKDEDIAYLYNLLDVNEGVRYYINP